MGLELSEFNSSSLLLPLLYPVSYIPEVFGEPGIEPGTCDP
jgi:hypothetical protein